MAEMSTEITPKHEVGAERPRRGRGKRGPGRPKGSKNKPGRPKGSKNKPGRPKGSKNKPGRPKGPRPTKEGAAKRGSGRPKGVSASAVPLKGYVKQREARRIAKDAVAAFKAKLPKLITRELKKLLR